MPPTKCEYNAVSAITDEIWQYRTVETSRYLTKITTLRRAIAARSKVLAAKHTVSLQLLCTAGGNHARLDARTEFEILHVAVISLDCHQLYRVNVANSVGYTQGPF